MKYSADLEQYKALRCFKCGISRLIYPHPKAMHEAHAAGWRRCFVWRCADCAAGSQLSISEWAWVAICYFLLIWSLLVV